MGSIEFQQAFHDLTGHLPLSWQERLCLKWAKDEVDGVIDLPTGLGKTSACSIAVQMAPDNDI